MNDEQKQAIDIANRIEDAIAGSPKHLVLNAIAMVISAHLVEANPSRVSDCFDILKRSALAYHAHFANKEPSNG